MKLIKFTHQVGYKFILFFENGTSKECDLKELIGKHVSLQQIKTAQINGDWGCLEFNAGMTDIEPKTLYHYAYGINHKSRLRVKSWQIDQDKAETVAFSNHSANTIDEWLDGKEGDVWK